MMFTKNLSGFTRCISLLLMLMVMGVMDLQAQTSEITGVVRSSEGETIPGVTVMLKGSGTGTSTDMDGAYKLTVNDPNGTLMFSSIGMIKQEIPINGRSTIDVTMEMDVAQLDMVEVVDYGYGTVKKTDMTGSVASMSGKELAKIPVASAAQAITGRLPGVRVLTTDGSPGADVVIRVRGGGSVTQDNSPLYVVDGFIVGSIRDIPPTDIESITVLKDAAATAIYGAQAANGVIVVTTKTPKAGKTSISYNNFFQWKSLPKDRRYNVLNAYEYVLANYEYAKLQSNAAVRNFEKFYGVYDDLELYQQKPTTDWQDELFGDPKLSQYHNLSISGGTEKTKFMLSLTNNTDEGLMLNSGYMRNVINFKLNHQLADRLTMDVGARVTHTVIDGAGTSGNAQISIKDAVQTRPTNGIADELDIDMNQINSEDDFQSFLLSLVSPVELAKQDWRKRTEYDYVFNAGLTWEVIDNLNFKSTFNGSRDFRENLRFYGPLTGESFNNGNNMPLGQREDRSSFSYRWLNSVSYKFDDLGTDHDLDFLVGQEVYSSGGKRSFLRAEDFRLSITPEELFANMTFGRADRHETEDYTNSNRFSLFGRANYQFKGKYLFTATVRSDASSKFSKDNRVGVFPAVAVGWKISEEDFLKASSWVDELKLRLSWGETGNDRIETTATQFLFSASTNRGPGFGNTDNVFYQPSSSTLYNPDLKWETTITKNIGLDFTLFKAKVEGSLDFYRNVTRDLLLQSAIPPNTGFSTQWNNVGSTSNQGVELGINAFIIDKPDFSLSVNFNTGLNQARVEELDGTNERFFQSNWASTDLNNINDFYLRVGGKIGDVFGYVTDGYYTEDDFEGYDAAAGEYILKADVPNSTSVVGNTNIRPGFLKLKDLNDDGQIDADDRKVIGNTLPKNQGGFGVNARWKGFDAAIFFNYQFGNDVYNTGKIQYNQFRRVTYGNMLTTMSSENRYTYLDVDGTYTGTPGEIVTDLGQLEEMNAGKNIWSHNSYGIAGAVIHSWAIEDGSFIRLNNLTVGYSLPTELISRIGLSQFRIYATGNNLKLWTDYTGYDPEVSTSRSSSYSALTPGVDYSSFPRSRSYTVGVNVTF
ncbi:SusC/RagA family TonB-linked outer membrane protein [Echinicola vietnamensis]|uniref:TonB-linked outer membrane protein, SusC/RagA family n=1 Tax=Echinicola vietnamensis (strain DSM 17526 / LMG 23754 / KMM 6221) TaxID=926556 RepID=L0G2U3_ECHVK|nr:TonB-dependent receptor [Echinicola vietnamensis]AGA79321.1 TonB-linked outer membrane protein, SusC/RagA family [Echinicola vietnamensis DSM 17526]